MTYRSTDRGLTWQLYCEDGRLGQVLVVDPVDPNRQYALGTVPDGMGNIDVVILGSTDRGSTWSLLGEPVEDHKEVYYGLGFFRPQVDRQTFLNVSTNLSGVFATGDQGVNWHQEPLFAVRAGDMAPDPFHARRLYLGSHEVSLGSSRSHQKPG